jgi:hypothetical protein
MHQGKDCGGRANAKSKRQHGGGGETGGMNKLPHRIANVVHEVHSASEHLYGPVWQIVQFEHLEVVE